MMRTTLKIAENVGPGQSVVLLASKDSDFSAYLSDKETAHWIKKMELKDRQASFNHFDKWVLVMLLPEEKERESALESARRSAAKHLGQLNGEKVERVAVVDLAGDSEMALAYAEGLALANYQYLKFFSQPDDKRNSLAEIALVAPGLPARQVELLAAAVGATCVARDLVNEPPAHLTSEDLGKRAKELGKEHGFEVEVLGKRKIEALKMGGLLAVNRGSAHEPTFSVLEWAPKGAPNADKPIVLVGKGVVYDTGGLSLKPTPKSMDFMKADMGGAAAVIGAFCALADARLPLRVVGLIPSTDNRINGHEYAPGDVITMHGGTTVEVLNTDAEGRLLLADALSYAKRFQPGLVIDLATLTGAAARALGKEAIAAMRTADDATFEALRQCGERTRERLVEFPLWPEYGDYLKSTIADLKNLGGQDAGAITAGKFLQHFTDYPWVHLDIAGSAFLHSKDSYRGRDATGVGVRLLFEFLLRQAAQR